MSAALAQTTAAVAAPLSVEVTADRTAVTVGDPVRLTFRMRHAPDVTVVSFDADRALAALTRLDQTEAAPRPLEDGRIEEGRVVTLAAYETGTKEIAPVRIVYRDAAGRFDHVMVMTKTKNVYLVIVVDLTGDGIHGHHLLDLNEKYGLTSDGP